MKAWMSIFKHYLMLECFIDPQNRLVSTDTIMHNKINDLSAMAIELESIY
jgi:hypothetical protein